MALIDRFALCARWPAKSSVQSWFSGSKPLSFRYSAHFGQRAASTCCAKSALPSDLGERRRGG